MKNPKSFLQTTDIIVPLTYTFTDPPTKIAFPCKLAMSADDEAARQAFYAQGQGEIDAGLHKYHLDFLGRVMTGPPEGLPGFEDFVKDQIVADYNATPEANNAGKARLDRDSIDVATAAGPAQLIEYFKAYMSEPTQLATKIAADAVNRYNRITQPDELFR